MIQTKEYIWYASYGSNILEERFHCYIKGGRPQGSNKTHDGCTDKSLPLDKEKIYINSEIYFAGESMSWNKGGVCFLKTNFEQKVQTLGRMYLITREQFIDIVRQEMDHRDGLNIDLNKVIADGSLIVKRNSWYGNLIYLGMQNDFPIFTFTNEENFQQTNKPDKNYLKTIIKGIQETYNLGVADIVEYFISKAGIAGNFTKDDLIKIIQDVD